MDYGDRWDGAAFTYGAPTALVITTHATIPPPTHSPPLPSPPHECDNRWLGFPHLPDTTTIQRPTHHTFPPALPHRRWFRRSSDLRGPALPTWTRITALLRFERTLPTGGRPPRLPRGPAFHYTFTLPHPPLPPFQPYAHLPLTFPHRTADRVMVTNGRRTLPHSTPPRGRRYAIRIDAPDNTPLRCPATCLRFPPAHPCYRHYTQLNFAAPPCHYLPFAVVASALHLLTYYRTLPGPYRGGGRCLPRGYFNLTPHCPFWFHWDTAPHTRTDATPQLPYLYGCSQVVAYPFFGRTGCTHTATLLPAAN